MFPTGKNQDCSVTLTADDRFALGKDDQTTFVNFNGDTGKFFSKVKMSLVVSTTFELSRQKLDAKLLENGPFGSNRNLKW